MKKLTLSLLTICFSLLLTAQSIIKLPYENPKGITWANAEKEYFFDFLQSKIVTNVSMPTMEVYKAADSLNTGTAVIIAPGGGMFIQSIYSEGRDVAAWLNKKGITAFVLKYRLVPTGEDGGKELVKITDNDNEHQGFIAKVSQIMPFAVKDALSAIEYVRTHAAEYGVKKDKIGYMGFSAGGSVGFGVSYYFKNESRPDFLALIYPGTTLIPTQNVKKDAPPLFLAAAQDDFLGLIPGILGIYNDWFKNGIKAELHLYSQGNHGFGMNKLNLPSDKWIDRFYEWAVAEKFIIEKK